jgi:hypothetical protein
LSVPTFLPKKRAACFLEAFALNLKQFQTHACMKPNLKSCVIKIDMENCHCASAKKYHVFFIGLTFIHNLVVSLISSNKEPDPTQQFAYVE